MKNLLVFSILLFCQIGLRAQSDDFAPVGATWYYCEYTFGYPIVYPARQYSRRVEATKDTLVQGQTCRKIEGLAGGGIPETAYVFSRLDSVFYWSRNSNKFELLYDFGANAGESWVTYGLTPYYGYDSLRVIVDSVSLMVVNNEILRVQHISSEPPRDFWTLGDRIIEGLGNIDVFAPVVGLGELAPCGLRCYTDSDTDLHFVTYACDTMITADHELDIESNISISPNPAGDFFLVQTALSGSYDVEVCTILGQNLKAITCTGNTNIPINDWPSGVYWLRLRQNGQTLGVRKLVVER